MLLWILSFSARAAGDPKAEITDIEHKARAASTTDELMAFYDPNEIITYDYIPELRYVGAKAVHADIDHFFSNTEDLKGNFVDLKVYTDGPVGVAHSLQHFTWKDNSGVRRKRGGSLKLAGPFGQNLYVQCIVSTDQAELLRTPY